MPALGCRDSLDVGKERIEYGLLFRWFVGLGIDEVVWDATTFTNHRDRLLDGDVAAKFLSAVLSQSRVNLSWTIRLVPQQGLTRHTIGVAELLHRGLVGSVGRRW